MKKYIFEEIVNLYKNLNGYKEVSITMPGVSFVFKRFTNKYHGILVINNLNAICLDKTNLETIKNRIFTDSYIPEDLPFEILTIVIDSFKVSRLGYLSDNVVALNMVNGKSKIKVNKNVFNQELALLDTYITRTLSTATWIEGITGIMPKDFRAWMVYFLIILNVAIYGYVNSSIADKYGISVLRVLMHGDSIRLVTYMFLHAGLIHLVSNMFALFLYGRVYEKRHGTIKTFTIYFVGGIYAGIVSILASVLFGNYDNITVGASGAIFALLGAYICDCVSDNTKEKQHSKVLIIYTIYMIIAGMFRSNIDVACHIGGVIIGFMIQRVFILLGNINSNKKYNKVSKKLLNTEMKFITKRI